MEPVYERAGIRVYHGDNRDVVPQLAEQFAAVVTDPPYGLSFMGKAWDHGVPGEPFWRVFGEAMLPGAHMLAFGGTRTYHRIAVAIEDAGFEMRDTLQWLYGSGFPKSLDVSKAIDKAMGADREVVGYDASKARPNKENFAKRNDRQPTSGAVEGWKDNGATITAPATPEAERWAGWGTALKPAYEPIILARKPLTSTVAAQVLSTGTGALNIDGTRIPTDDNLNGGAYAQSPTDRDNWVTNTRKGDKNSWRRGGAGDYEQPSGRWPANVLLDPDAAAALDQMSGERPGMRSQRDLKHTPSAYFGADKHPGEREGYNDTGGASRFFPVLPIDAPDTLRFLYTPKASRAERNAGLDGLPERHAPKMAGGEFVNPLIGSSNKTVMRQNHHPTVKPLALCRWLLTLVTPPGGVVLDPFAGSGSTGVAAAQLGIPCVLIEQEDEYLPIIIGRIDHALGIIRQGRLF
jgi:DNA modification methylase